MWEPRRLRTLWAFTAFYRDSFYLFMGGKVNYIICSRKYGPLSVSRRLPTAAARVQTRVWSCGIFWWTKVALGQVFSENFGLFPLPITFHLLLHNHLHYHPRWHNRPGVAAVPIASQTRIKENTTLRRGRLRGRGSSPGKVKNILFSVSSRPSLGSTQPSLQWVPGALSSGVERQGHEADHLPPASAEVKETWIYTSTSPYPFMA
jgi:hypothetical protein